MVAISIAAPDDTRTCSARLNSNLHLEKPSLLGQRTDEPCAAAAVQADTPVNLELTLQVLEIYRSVNIRHLFYVAT